MFYINTDFESPDRFDLGRFMDYKTDVYDPLDSFFIIKLPSLLKRSQYAIQNEEDRPDLLAFRFFNEVTFWWMALRYNALLSAKDLVAGLTLSLPSEEDISELYFRLKALETLNT